MYSMMQLQRQTIGNVPTLRAVCWVPEGISTVGLYCRPGERGGLYCVFNIFHNRALCQHFAGEGTSRCLCAFDFTGLATRAKVSLMAFSTTPRRRPSFAAASMSDGLTPFAGQICAPRALAVAASRTALRRSSFCAFLQPPISPCCHARVHTEHCSHTWSARHPEHCESGGYRALLVVRKSIVH